MKTSILVLLLICSIFSFSANFLLIAAQTGVPQPVLDTSGQALRHGVNYYILPAKPGNGGGLTLALSRNGSCPYEIVQTLNSGTNGLPLRFSPFDNDTIIRVSTDHNIRFVNFSSPVVCPQSNIWQLDVSQESLPPNFVTTGGVEGNHGRDTILNWFKIEKYEDAYQIEFCPSVPCPPPVQCQIICGNIGILVDNGRRRLAIFQSPFKIVFKRA